MMNTLNIAATSLLASVCFFCSVGIGDAWAEQIDDSHLQAADRGTRRQLVRQIEEKFPNKPELVQLVNSVLRESDHESLDLVRRWLERNDSVKAGSTAITGGIGQRPAVGWLVELHANDGSRLVIQRDSLPQVHRPNVAPETTRSLPIA